MITVWPFINNKSGGYNKTGLIFAILALADLSTRPRVPSTKVSLSHKAQQVHWLPAALALGSLIFSIHNLLAESSTLVAWSWTGYENGVPRGPLPHVHSALTILVQCAGLALGTYASLGSTSSSLRSSDKATRSNGSAGLDGAASRNHIHILISHPSFYAFGATSTYVLYMYRNWLGYAGGLGMAFFLMCVTPIVFEYTAAATSNGKTHSNVGRTLGTAFLVYCLMILASIFTVAYAFVPGGVYFRERTDL